MQKLNSCNKSFGLISTTENLLLSKNLRFDFIQKLKQKQQKNN